MSARTQMCFGDTLAEVGYNYLRMVGTSDAPYFLNLFRTLFNANYRDFSAAYPDVEAVFREGIDTPEKLSRTLLTLFLWKMGYLRGVTDAEGYYTGTVLPGSNPRVRQIMEEATTPEAMGRRAAQLQRRLENVRAFSRGFPVRSEADLGAWFRNASSVATWQPTFRDLTPATAEAQLSASNAACESASSTSLLADAFDFTPVELLPYGPPPPGTPPVVTPRTPGTPPATVATQGSGFNVGMLVAGAAFGWLVTRFFR